MQASNSNRISSRKRVSSFLKNSTALLYVRQSNILSAAFVIMLMLALSRILGLVRDRLLAGYFDSSALGIYFAAFRIPDLLFQLLVFGALSVAFIPVFTEYFHKDENEAWKLSSSLVTITFLLFGIVSFFVFIFARPLSVLVVPGIFSQDGKHIDLLVNLTRIVLFAQFFFVISSFYTGILQSFQRFLVPAIASVFYNLGIIFGILFLGSSFGIYGPAIGAVLGACFHLLIQLPLVYRLGFRYKFSFNINHPGVKEVGKLIIPRTLALAADQFSLTVSTVFASLISLKSITFLNFAQHLQVVPLGLFSATIAQAALPTLSLEHSKNKPEEFKTTFLTSFHQILFLVVPASALLITLRIPMVRLIFGASRFDWEATIVTGKTVAMLSLGLFAQAVAALLIRGFYAMKDTVTPLKISFIAVFVNVILNCLFIAVLKEVWWLGLASSIANVLEALILLYFLDKKVGGFEQKKLIFPALKIGTSGVILAFVLWRLMKLLDQMVFDTTRTINLLILTGIVSFIGMSLYILLTWLFKVKEVTVFWQFFKRITHWKQVFSRSEEVIEDARTNP